MRLTFPALSTNSPTNYCTQAALACLPFAVDLLAQRFFPRDTFLGHPSNVGIVLGFGTLATLKNNKWALGGGTLLWGIYKLSAYLTETSMQPAIVISAPSENRTSVLLEQPSPETPFYYDISEVTALAPSVIHYIERNCIDDPTLYSMGGADSIRKGTQVMDVYQSLANLGPKKASKAGAIFKNLYKFLKTPLLQ